MHITINDKENVIHILIFYDRTTHTQNKEKCNDTHLRTIRKIKIGHKDILTIINVEPRMLLSKPP